MAHHSVVRYFKKGAKVEISSDDDGFRGSWYEGTVIRPPRNAKRGHSKVLVEYKNLTEDEEGTQPLREELDVVQLRPPPPRENRQSFKFGEEVDAYYSDGWWEGTITEVVRDDEYLVFFSGTKEQIAFKAPDMRLHREWEYGKWVPPLDPVEKDVMPDVPMECDESAEVEVKIEHNYSPGDSVEVSNNEEGFEGAWFSATILKKSKRGIYLIEYETLKDDDGKTLLREEADNRNIRPCPPDVEIVDRFGVLEQVDAYYNDGWWTGVISKVLRGGRYSVFFSTSGEEIKFNHADLRVHHDWINGKWETSKKSAEVEANNNEEIEHNYSPGDSVEVSSNEEGFEGAWFSATIIKKLEKGKYLIEYEGLKDDDGKTLLREEADSRYIRPCPPDVEIVDRFGVHEHVDALYNDGWWTGVISKVLKDDRYSVYFSNSDEEIKFNHSDLRMHQDWINGKWESSKVQKL